jgi:tetratricopeptide (TPR) repeat protein
MGKGLVETLRRNLWQALKRGELEEAENILVRLKREDPLSRDTRGLELEFYLNANRLQEANVLADQLCSLFPDSSRILFLAGKLAYKQKQYEEAARRLRESQRAYPHPQTQYWLGKTLTQTGQFDEAESLLLLASVQNRHAFMDLAWLYERKNDLEAALDSYRHYLQYDPENSFAREQLVRIKARMLEPEAFIEEVDSLAELGERTSDELLPEFVQKLFETGQTSRAREEVVARLETTDGRLGARLAWVCYRARAYDLACSLFLRHLAANLSNYKYLTALETAAAKAGRLQQLVDSYNSLASQAPHLYGRCRSLSRRMRQ